MSTLQARRFDKEPDLQVDSPGAHLMGGPQVPFEKRAVPAFSKHEGHVDASGASEWQPGELYGTSFS
jgi:hypothetical protein